jgi:hypothetical protein
MRCVGVGLETSAWGVYENEVFGNCGFEPPGSAGLRMRRKLNSAAVNNFSMYAFFHTGIRLRVE